MLGLEPKFGYGGPAPANRSCRTKPAARTRRFGICGFWKKTCGCCWFIFVWHFVWDNALLQAQSLPLNEPVSSRQLLLQTGGVSGFSNLGCSSSSTWGGTTSLKIVAVSGIERGDSTDGPPHHTRIQSTDIPPSQFHYRVSVGIALRSPPVAFRGGCQFSPVAAAEQTVCAAAPQLLSFELSFKIAESTSWIVDTE